MVITPNGSHLEGRAHVASSTTARFPVEVSVRTNTSYQAAAGAGTVGAVGWSCCTQAFLKHPDRDRTIAFMIDRTLKNECGHESLNHVQVLGMSKDVRAIAAIRPGITQLILA